jgi:hypothetical protein
VFMQVNETFTGSSRGVGISWLANITVAGNCYISAGA